MKIVRPIITFDTETTGVDTVEDRIVQIAAIKRFPDGITDEMVKNAPTFKQLAFAMGEWFRDSDISGFNTDQFDCNIMLSEMSRCNLTFLDWDCNFVDVMKLYRHFYPNTQEAIYERFFGEKLENAHDALADCKASDRILEKIIKDNLEDEITPKEIDLLLQDNKNRVDMAGHMYRDMEGVVKWNFSKNKDKPVLADIGFKNWFMSQPTFPQESKNKIKQLINNGK